MLDEEGFCGARGEGVGLAGELDELGFAESFEVLAGEGEVVVMFLLC